MRYRLCIVTRVLLAATTLTSAAAGAQKVADFASPAPPVPPTIEASENTPLDYMGGVPAPIVGALDADDSTYNRLVTCASLSGVGTAVAYDTVTITNNSGGVADFVVTTTLVGGAPCPSAAGVDTFLTAYSPNFNPATPLTNCVVVNDDISGASDRCSSISFSVAPLGVAVVVVTSFGNGALFDYQVNFDGTTPVELLSFSVD